MKWMEIAWGKLGTAETAGEAANPAVMAFFADAKHAEITSDEVPWCAAFVGSCLERADIRSTRALNARSYCDFGQQCEPRPGAIAVFARGDNSAQGHVGFVAGVTGDTIQVLGGNQGDAVSVKPFPRSNVIACRWPGDPATASDLAKDGSRIAKAAKRGQIDAGALTATAGAAAAIPAPDLAAWATTAKTMQGALGTLMEFGVFCWSRAAVLALLAAGYFGVRLVINSGLIAKWRAEDHNTGKTS